MIVGGIVGAYTPLSFNWRRGESASSLPTIDDDATPLRCPRCRSAVPTRPIGPTTAYITLTFAYASTGALSLRQGHMLHEAMHDAVAQRMEAAAAVWVHAECLASRTPCLLA